MAITDMPRVMVDSESELTTVATRFGEGVVAYCKDTDKVYKLTSAGWSENAVQASIGTLAASLSNKADVNDVRLSDARTPLPHSHPQSDISGLTSALNAKEGALGNPSANGQVLSSTTAGARSWVTPSGLNPWTRIVLASDVPSSTVANALIDIPGLSIPLIAGQRCWFNFRIIYSAAALTTGSRWSLNGPAVTGPNSGLNYSSEYSLTTTATTRNPILTAYNLPATCNTNSALLAGNIAVIEGFIQPSANGSLVVRFASEVTNSLITAKAGSFGEHTTA